MEKKEKGLHTFEVIVVEEKGTRYRHVIAECCYVSGDAILFYKGNAIVGIYPLHNILGCIRLEIMKDS